MKRAKSNLPVPSEYDEQVSLFAWAKMQERAMPELELLFSTLNGVRLPMGLAVKAKKAGMKSGVPDVILPIPIWPVGVDRPIHGLFIEMKRRDASPSDTKIEQTKFLNLLTEWGYQAIVCRGWDEARIAILRHLGRET
jgi:hypothetical protein